jgi:hypothetical protein
LPGRRGIILLFLLIPLGLAAQEITGELVLRAYRSAFPEKAGSVERRDGDWAITLGNETFFWAQGRLLPRSLRDSWESYAPYGYYRYPQEEADPGRMPAEQIERLRFQGSAEARRNRTDHNPLFEAALYGGTTRVEVERNLGKIKFLNHEITVHTLIRAPLARVEQAIREAARTDPELDAFVRSISSIGCYNWRRIRGTQRLSYHSRGLAVDIQPQRLGGRAIYWQWEQDRNPDWMLIPLDRRWRPPAKVIGAFEKEGFTWGGRWALYDNMHFEYRPELLEIRRLLDATAEAPARPPRIPAH